MTQKPKRRHAFTLVEMTIALVAGAALLGGLSASLYIASQAARPRGSDTTLQATRSLQAFADELEFAIKILDRTEKSIEFVVADRDSDGKNDSIRYEWNGVAGGPLTRSFNGGAMLTVVEDVHDFDITYRVKTTDETWQVQQESSEASLALNTNASYPMGGLINSQFSMGQYIHPSKFAVTLPVGTQSWSISKVRFVATTSGSQDGAMWVQIRRADANRKPTSTILAQVRLDESQLSTSYSVEEIDFDPPINDISIFDGVCLVFSRADGDAVGRLVFDAHGNGDRVYSSDYQRSWAVGNQSELIYRVIGSLSYPDSQSIERKYVTGVATELRVGANSRANRVSFQIPNCPELLDASWRADFDTDPTSLDDDFDGTNDWAHIPSGTFDSNELWQGTWKTNSAASLTTAVDSNFSTLTTIEYSARDLDAGNGGVVVWLNADWDGSTYVPIVAELSLLANDTQTLILKTTVDGSDRILATVNDIPAKLTAVRITIEPTVNVINLFLNHVEVGTYDYVPQSASHSNKRAGIMSVSSAFQVDYLSIRTAEVN